jgi:hypothetical protein
MHMFCHLASKSCTCCFAPLNRPKRKQNGKGSGSAFKDSRANKDSHAKDGSTYCAGLV